jgi:hypothetical protein
MNAVLMLICMFAGTDSTAADGTVSVLKRETSEAVTPVAVTPVAVAPVAVTPVGCDACVVEEARAVRLSPWHVRRLNRIADRQEVRDACNCRRECCDCRGGKVLLLKPTSPCRCR